MARVLVKEIVDNRKNFIINGALDFHQRWAGASNVVNTASTINGYMADRVNYGSVGSTVKNYSLQRNTDIPTIAQSGFGLSYSHNFGCLTGIPSFAAGDFIYPWNYNMEGYDYGELHGKSCVLAFWFQAQVNGTYGVVFKQAGAGRTYTTTFSYSGSTTWQKIVVPITFETSGSYNVNNSSLGISISIGSVGGSTFISPANNVWQTGDYPVAAGVTNWFSTALNYIRIAGVQLNIGTTVANFQRYGINLEDELKVCQRYYEKSYGLEQTPGTATLNGMFAFPTDAANANNAVLLRFKVTKRNTSYTTPIWDAVGAAGVYTSYNTAYVQANGQTGLSNVGQNEEGWHVRLTTGSGRVAAFLHWAVDAEF